jgi:hypothetical protein
LRTALADYREAMRHGRIAGGDWLLGLLSGLVLGLLAVVLSKQVWTATLSVVVLAATVAIRMRQRGRKGTRMRDALKRRVHALAEEHPDEVLTWGGEAVLLNADLLPEIVASFEDDLRTLSTEVVEEAR